MRLCNRNRNGQASFSINATAEAPSLSLSLSLSDSTSRAESSPLFENSDTGVITFSNSSVVSTWCQCSKQPPRSTTTYCNASSLFRTFATIVAMAALLASPLVITTAHAALLQGCNFDETLCEKFEVCIPDGLFGQCYSDGESEVLKPLVIDRTLDAYVQELLRLELRRLAAAGINWPHARAQCTLAYFKFSVVYALPYDAQFCAVRNPNNIWALIQEVQTVIATENEAREEFFRDSLLRNGFLRANENDNELERDNIGAADDNSEDGAAEEPRENGQRGEFSALLFDDDHVQALQPQSTTLEGSQLQSANASAIFDTAIEQLKTADRDKRSNNGQVNFDLFDSNSPNVEGDYAIVPNMLADATDTDDTEVSNAKSLNSVDDVDALVDERATKWNAWLAGMLAAAPHASLSLLGSDGVPLPVLSDREEKQLDDYVTDMLNNRRADLTALNDSQLEKLVAFINSLKVMLQQKAAQLQRQAASELSTPEMEEVIPLTSQINKKQLLLKKDAEKFDNSDMGLSNIVHKIVKGGIQRVEGNRVYLKVNEHADKEDTKTSSLSETQLMRLIDFLDRKIAAPNNLFFDDFAYENGQLSFRVSRVKFLPALKQLFENINLDDIDNDDAAMTAAVNESEKLVASGEKEHEAHAAFGNAVGITNNDSAKKGQKTHLESASSVAQAVYKRRKDIETLAGVEVDETGIGSGLDIVPIGGGSRPDRLFMVATAVCAVSLVVVASLLAMQLVRVRRSLAASTNAKKSSDVSVPEVIDYIEEKPSTIYEDLCRQRMNGQDAVVVPVRGPSGTSPSTAGAPGAVSMASKHSSTSSWPDDTYLQSSNLDISTGHVLLGFLKNCLEKPDEISNQWSQLNHYRNESAEKTIAQRPENVEKNFDNNIVPYDDSVIMVSAATQLRTRSRPLSEEQESQAPMPSQIDKAKNSERKYVNASRIFDADPRQVAYIASQAPLRNTVADFWQMIWQEGVVVIVNLTDWPDDQNQVTRYWPREEEGSKVFGALEVNLVSEHSFNQDYVVRSIYLKNLNTNETRTVTQFHYVSWKDGILPRSIESLLEFRRKVNKSYRGHSSPVLVHCTNGAGRTGTYILIDMVMNRILKGVKELNIAASLEHLRDQRMNLIETEAQYKLVFRCVAEEVSVLLKNLQH